MAVATNWFDRHSFFFVCVFIFNNEKIYRFEVV